MPKFHTAASGARLVLDPAETQLLRQLTDEFRTLLRSGRADRGDPVYDRLFPSAYEAPKDEIAYRDLVGDDLEQHKLKALDVVSASLGSRRTDVVIEGEDFEAWIQSLTDLRLAIGTRLDVDEEAMQKEIDPHEPDAQAMSILHWLGWLQEGLLSSMPEG
ncbi:MAG: DUF2017 domain-containing protein [Actinobacteria bacterium]|nr:DUF2017 domain-containing protein [Actinomycetota bacterium]